MSLDGEEHSKVEKLESKIGVITQPDSPGHSITTITKPSISTRAQLGTQAEELQSKRAEDLDTVHVAHNDRFIFWCCIALASTSFPLGWDVGTTGSLIDNESFPYKNISPAYTGILVSSFIFGSLVGCSTLSSLRLDLKIILRLGALIYSVGSLIEALSLGLINKNPWGFISGRFISGITCGTFCVVGPLYMSEIVVDGFSKRGLYLSLFQTFTCMTILLGNSLKLVCPGKSLIIVTVAAKLMFIVLLNVLLVWVPSSIKNSVISGNEQNLCRSLTRLYVIEDSQKEHALQSIKDELTRKYDAHQSSLLAVLKIPENRSKLFRCCCLMAFQQLTGVNYFFYYGRIVFESKYAIVLLSTINLAGSLASGPLIQCYEMRHILGVNALIMSAMMSIYASVGPSLVQLLMVASCGFIFCFAISWGPCCGIITNVISNNDAAIVSSAVAVNWGINWMVLMATPTLIDTLGFAYGYVFVANLVAMAMFSWQFLE